MNKKIDRSEFKYMQSCKVTHARVCMCVCVGYVYHFKVNHLPKHFLRQGQPSLKLFQIGSNFKANIPVYLIMLMRKKLTKIFVRLEKKGVSSWCDG